MLCLTRAKDEAVVIDLSGLTPETLAEMQASGDAKIEVIIVDYRGNKVRIGIEAPKQLPVHRGEIQQRIEKGKGAA